MVKLKEFFYFKKFIFILDILKKSVIIKIEMENFVNKIILY